MISLILCTHNPRPEFLQQAMTGLRQQSLRSDQWELIVIDNASRPSVSKNVIDWHLQGRLVVEQELGLSAARRRGISESQSDLIVFVDDDNVLGATYLENAVQLAHTHPHIGVFGGNIRLALEAPLPQWYKPYIYMLAERSVQKPTWCNYPNAELAPCGAGMVIRRQVAERYMAQPAVLQDRTGKSLSSGGDTDMAFTACDLNLGMGLFPDLELTHLIPKERLTRQYLHRLVQGITCSSYILLSQRGLIHTPPLVSMAILAVRMCYHLVMGKPAIPEWFKVMGTWQAIKELRGMQWTR